MDTSFCRICHTMPNQYKLSSSCFSTSASNYWLPRYFCGKESRPEGQKEGTTFEDVILLTRVLNMMHNTNWYKNYNLMRPKCPCLQRLASWKLWRQCVPCPLFTAEALFTVASIWETLAAMHIMPTFHCRGCAPAAWITPRSSKNFCDSHAPQCHHNRVPAFVYFACSWFSPSLLPCHQYGITP